MIVMQAVQNLLSNQPLIDQTVLNPVGLLAIFAVIPLLIFYLMKPKPEEQVMPSIMFFQEEKEDDKLRKAYRKLISNLPLLLQILAVLFFSLALAEPYFNSVEDSEKKVIVLDRSASVSNDFDGLKEEVLSRAGETNTLITASDAVKVRLEEGGRSDLQVALNSLQSEHTETDVVSAVQVAQNYEGDLLIASDLDQTLDSREVEPVLDEMTSRNVETVAPQVDNKWGVVDLEPSENQTTVEVSNFEQRTSTLQVEHGQETREVVLAPESTRELSFESRPGKNVVSLPGDGMEADNEAYYVVPENEVIEVRVIGEVDEYFGKAIELIDGVEIVEKSSEIGGSDVYVVSDGYEDSMVESLNEEVSNGSVAVLMPNNNAVSDIFDYNGYEEVGNKSVEIRSPVRVSIGKTLVKETNFSEARSLTGQSNAIQTMEHGDGKLILYNMVGDEFENEVLYPVFWKELLREMVDEPGIEELNRETGTQVSLSDAKSPTGETVQGRTKLSKAGFYSSDSKTYASNLESRQESKIETDSYSINADEVRSTNKKSLQNLSILLILTVVGIELLYLRYRGEL